jgi:polyphosphate glucokinase
LKKNLISRFFPKRLYIKKKCCILCCTQITNKVAAMIKTRKILGIDIGGSGIKGAPINTESGKLTDDRYRVPTPIPATPEAVAREIKDIAAHFKWKGVIGIGYPGVVQQGVTKTAANIDKSWIGLDANNMFKKFIGSPCWFLNDADAAGIAEVKFGAGKEEKGVVLVLTIGTGIGTVLFSKGKLVPNLEFGHIKMYGASAEKYCSDAARKEQNLSWEDWAKRLDEYLHYLEDLIWPDLIVIGGGISKKPEKFIDLLTIKAPITPAKLLNNAGMIGAAMAAKIAKVK